MPTHAELWQAQLDNWADSREVPEAEAAEWPFDAQDPIRRDQIALLLVCTMQYPNRVYYECGRRPDGSYKWRGCRYGVDGGDYLSGFSVL